VKIESNTITTEYHINRQRYLMEMVNDRRRDELRYQEVARKKESIERINRARELNNQLGQKVDTYA